MMPVNYTTSPFVRSNVAIQIVMNSLSLMISQLWNMKTTTIRICVNSNTTRSNLCCNHQTIQENTPTVIYIIFRVRLSRGIFNSLSRMHLFTSGVVAWSFCLVNRHPLDTSRDHASTPETYIDASDFKL